MVGTGTPQAMSRVIDRCAHSSTTVDGIPAAANTARPFSNAVLSPNCTTTFLPGAYLLLCGGNVDVALRALYASSCSPSKRTDGSTFSSVSAMTEGRHAFFLALPSIQARSTSDTFHMSRNQWTVSRISGVVLDSTLFGSMSAVGSCWWPHRSHSSL